MADTTRTESLTSQRPPSWLTRQRSDRARLSLRRNLPGYLFIAPWLIGVLLWQIGPFIGSLVLSFTDYSFTRAEWVGISNYEEAFLKDTLFWQSLKNTFLYTAVSVPLGLFIAFCLALLLNQRVRGGRFFRTAFFLPTIVTGTAAAFMWALVFNPRLGLLNRLLALLGIDGPFWLGDPVWALPSFILMSVWGFGGSMMIFLAALQNVPQELYDAAAVDGATAWRRLRHITIPMVTPTTFFLLILNFISSFQVFTNAYVLTQGGPKNATLFYMLHLYNMAFKQLRMGYASALAWILFLIVLAVTIFQVKLSGRWVYYEGEVR